MLDPIDDLLAEAGSVRDALHTALSAIHSIRSRATSEDGSVCAVVDGNGSLCELFLPDNIAKLNPVSLGISIVEAAASAALDAQQKRSNIVESMQISSPHLR